MNILFYSHLIYQTGYGTKYRTLPSFSVDSGRIHSAIVVCLAEFGSVTAFSHNLTFYELMIQLQVDICILDTILMLPEFGPTSGVLATVGEFVLCVTMT